MSDREEETPRGREPACLLCRRSEADPDICGDKIQKHGICAHVFCLYFASLLDQQENERVGLQGFLPREILHAVNRASHKSCCICGQSGATIACCETDCDLSFHLPCAKQGGCVTQFITPYRSYCPTHRPEQAVEATPEPGTQCLICMEPVEDRKTFSTMVCPACKTAWFHRDCIQGQALRSGFSSLQCPICRNRPAFLGEMFTLGIRIPFRLVSFCLAHNTGGASAVPCQGLPQQSWPCPVPPPTWEENDAFAELGERHRHCDASECFYPRGRQEAEEEGPWELLLCSSCAAEGTHRYCSSVPNSITSWECDNCARQSIRRHCCGTTVCTDNCDCDSCAERFTSSGEFSILARLMEESPAVSTEDETITPSTSQQAASEQSLESPSEEMSSPSLYSWVTSRPSHSNIPETEDSSCSRSRRPDRRQNRTRRQSRPQNPQHRSRSPHDRSHVPEPTAARCRPRQGQSGTSRRPRRSRRQSRPQNPHLRSPSPYDRRRSPHLRSPSPHDRICLPPPSPRRRSRSEEASETSSNRNRSRQQRRPQNPHLRSRSRRHRSHVRTPRAGSCTSTQEASETSSSRNRSRQQRRPQNPHLRSRSRRDRSHVPAPSTGRRRPSQEESGTSRRRSSSRRQSRTSNPSGRSRSPLDRNCTPAPSAGRRNSRETAARTSQREQHSRRQRRTSNSSNRSRSRRDGRRDRAPSAGSPTHRSDGETGTPH
ncbi:pineapple eye protein-like isoform X1 [Manacus candei]|uniref:pineapple eye protein-like isoform X1 n=1 Tax=Manacus candei TaxID=415023 RepID=UPI0022280B6D|nr:pineapple eye protein-like isoform X1 [Manacus candei]XP_051626058.1 pineapple eye protein-like isoform X1 [Manacus candei]XP_051626059.1 pineapple eye protein-like isoform X1 [Manacus candei]